MRKDMIAAGSLLIGVAALPTPDDVTVVSPIVQAVIGAGLILSGLFLKEKDESKKE